MPDNRRRGALRRQAEQFASNVGWDVRNGANAIADQFMGRRSLRKYAGGESPVAAPMPSDRAPIGVQYSDTVIPAAPEMAPQRGTAPPSAPMQSQAELDNQAWQEAQMRARLAIQQDGVPYFESPSVVNAGDALASAVDANRAAEMEQARREGVSWEDWWRFHGRQDQSNPGALPFDLRNAYRTGPAPARFGARSQRPGPR